MTQITALDLLWRFETHLGDLYLFFADSVAKDPLASRVFGRLALDEYGHAQQLAYQRRLIAEDPATFSYVDLDETALYRETARVKKARERGGPISITEAIALAIGFESSAADYHSRMALQQANMEFAGFLTQLGRADAEHRQRLEDLRLATLPAAPPGLPTMTGRQTTPGS